MNTVLLNKMLENTKMMTLSELIHRADFEFKQIRDKRFNPCRYELMRALLMELRLRKSRASSAGKYVKLIEKIDQLEKWVLDYDSVKIKN